MIAAAAAMLAAFFPLTGAINITGPVAQAAVVIQGPARVVDGDTLVINQQRIRLYGIDAPEKAQSCKNSLGAEYSCGQRSKEELTAKIGTQAVTCSVKNQDQYGRNVSVCTMGGGGLLGSAPLELNTWLVENGLAVAYRQYGKEYIPLEEQAKAQRKGVWEGPFTPPADWRKQQKAGGGGAAPVAAVAQLASRPVAAQAPDPACPGGALPIKGNISSSGEKIYHVPGGRSYNLVKIEVSSGEKFFCDEAQAQAAGWRASK